jgi:protein-disulfide isomerase
MKPTLLSDLLPGVLVVCALTVTAAVVRRDLVPRRAPGQPDLRVRRVDNWPELLQAGHWIGSPAAPLRIVEFSDVQCPFCARMHPLLEGLQRQHPDRVAVLYRHYPLDASHPLARPAARAAEGAGDQGRVAPFAALVFAHQDSLATLAWPALARQAGVADSARFARCLADPRTEARVERDARMARRTGMEVTPTLVVNGELHPGVMSQSQLDSLVASPPR